ncbi:MAG: hypothetical protein AAF242_15445, partial [Bacteroidota bacterium]
MKKTLLILALLVILIPSYVFSQCTFTERDENTNGLPNIGFVSGMAVAGDTFFIGTNVGLAITTDSGATHTIKTMADGLPITSVGKMIYHNGILYIATNAGLVISTDRGNTFTTKTTADGLLSNVINEVVIDNGKIYTYHESGNRFSSTGISVSEDGGTTFVSKLLENRGVENRTVYDNAFTVNQGRIFIGVSDGLLFSTDDGDSYRLIGPGTGFPDAATRGNSFLWDISVDGANIVVGSDDLYISSDFGKTFTTITYADGLGLTVNRVVFVNDNTIISAGWDGNIFSGVVSISSDGGGTFDSFDEDTGNLADGFRGLQYHPAR